MEIYTIDAKDKTIGQVASEVASVLRGKNRVDFKPNALPDVKVEVKNSSQVSISGKKMTQKEYKRYTGYPGGLKTHSMREVIDKSGYSELIKRAVRGMLPPNRLRPRALKNLEVTE